MKIIQFLEDHAALWFVLFVIGCAVSLIREFRKELSAVSTTRLKWLEWILLPPGFAFIFVTLQRESVRYFALHPQWTIAFCLGISGGALLLIIAKKRKRHAVLNWLGGLLGVPGLVFPLILVGLFLQSSKRFDAIRETYRNLAATEGQIAPDFAFTLLSNREERQLADYRGKVVLLNIWATWCVPCLQEMPDLDLLQKNFKTTGLIVINLSDERHEVIENPLAKNPMTTTHARAEKQNVPAFYQFGGARPTTFLIGTDGRVIASIIGAKDLGYFERIVKPYL